MKPVADPKSLFARAEAIAELPHLPFRVKSILDFRAEGVGDEPIPMLLHCPMCSQRHLDDGEFATKPHHTHACQFCGHVWRPAVVDTVGVQFLPGFKNDQ